MQFPRLTRRLIHCRSLKQAQYVKERLAQRLKECGLELHPDKTRIVYCKDVRRRGQFDHIEFDFLGYNFRPRGCRDRHGRLFTSFTLAMSPSAAKAARQDIRSWHLQLKSDLSLDDLARTFNPRIAEWVNYYCRFRGSAFHAVSRHINRALVNWALRKFKSLHGHKVRAIEWVQRRAQQRPQLFAHLEP